MKIAARLSTALAAALFVAAFVTVVAAESDPYEGLEPAVKEKLSKWDNGPEKIDVSAYPKEMRDLYETFAFKCSKCHTLARPINSDYATPQEWHDYVTKMSKKSRSGIRKGDVESISKFLAYDSSIRKKDLVAQKLAAEQESKKADPAKEPAKAAEGKKGE